MSAPFCVSPSGDPSIDWTLDPDYVEGEPKPRTGPCRFWRLACDGPDDGSPCMGVGTEPDGSDCRDYGGPGSC